MIEHAAIFRKCVPGLRYAVAATFILGLSGCPFTTAVKPSGPNLEWSGPKVYSSGSFPIPVAGLGIGAVVDQLPVTTPGAVTITRMLVNSGTDPVPAGFRINETVQALRFVSVAGNAGFVPASIPPITNQTILGQALAPGASMAVSFNIPVPTCGIYRETLTADAGGVVTEIDEGDNAAVHYFAVAGIMSVNIAVNPLGPLALWHDTAPPAPAWTRVAPAFPAATHTFTITAANPATTFHYSYYRPVVIGTFGAAAQLIGPPPVVPLAPPVGGPITITHQVTPRTHNVPATDILTDTAQEHFLPRVTAITGDGCMIRQATAQVSVVHP